MAVGQDVGGLGISDVSLSSGSEGAVSLSAGNELTIEMSGTANAMPLTVSFPGIANASDASAVCTDSVCIRQLVGDVYPDEVLTALDRVKVRDAMGSPVTESNFRFDVTADGVFTALGRVTVRDAMALDY